MRRRRDRRWGAGRVKVNTGRALDAKEDPPRHLSRLTRRRRARRVGDVAEGCLQAAALRAARRQHERVVGRPHRPRGQRLQEPEHAEPRRDVPEPDGGCPVVELCSRTGDLRRNRLAALNESVTGRWLQLALGERLRASRIPHMCGTLVRPPARPPARPPIRPHGRPCDSSSARVLVRGPSPQPRHSRSDHDSRRRTVLARARALRAHGLRLGFRRRREPRRAVPLAAIRVSPPPPSLSAHAPPVAALRRQRLAWREALRGEAVGGRCGAAARAGCTRRCDQWAPAVSCRRPGGAGPP